MRSKYQAQMVIQLNVRMYAIRNKVMVQHEPSCLRAIMLDIDGANIVRTRTGICSVLQGFRHGSDGAMLRTQRLRRRVRFRVRESASPTRSRRETARLRFEPIAHKHSVQWENSVKMRRLCKGVLLMVCALGEIPRTSHQNEKNTTLLGG